MGRPTIVFIGFMGAGKSTAVQSVQPSLKWTRDIDLEFEKEIGRSVRQFFDEEGESKFRAIEVELATRLLSEADGGAIALGGGTASLPEVQAALEDHLVVWLDVDAETAWRRVSESDRPLVRKGWQSFERLFTERLPVYERLAKVVIPVGDPKMVTRALPAIEALEKLPEGTRLIWATSSSGEYPIYVGPDLLETDWWPLEGRRFYVSDGNVAHRYVSRPTPFAGEIEIEPGEASKSMAKAEEVLRWLALEGMNREDHLVALGGGVVGDLAGLCAHLYQRGVPVVQVPTSLVAQVDSAYGGKTGVDLPEGKNYAGAYHLPAAVIADTSMLSTLPQDELAAGFVEALKAGLLAGGSLWEQVRSLETLDPGGLGDIVFASARYKCEVVAADERDEGRRHVLNLGHTVGHAIETATGYGRYRHGEAVALGLLAALRLSDAPELREEVAEILRRHNLPVRLDAAIDPDAILDALQRDKKRTADGVGFVLLSEPGKPRVRQLIDPASVRAAVEELYP